MCVSAYVQCTSNGALAGMIYDLFIFIIFMVDEHTHTQHTAHADVNGETAGFSTLYTCRNSYPVLRCLCVCVLYNGQGQCVCTTECTTWHTAL